MIGALSPAVSWLLFLACVAVGATVYVAIAGGRRYRRMEQACHEARRDTRNITVIPLGDPPWPTTWSPIDDANIRIIGGIYDAEARGDFEDAIAVWDEDEWKGYP